MQAAGLTVRLVGKQEVIQLSENADSDFGGAEAFQIRALLSGGSCLVVKNWPIFISVLR